MSVNPSPGRRRVQLDSDSDEDRLVIEDSCLNQSVSEVHDSSKASSILTSTPMSSKASSFLFPEDNETSAILSESMENMSLHEPKHSKRSNKAKLDTSSFDRSRSFMESLDESDVMSPISNKLAQRGDKVSTQKLRERLLWKSINNKKTTKPAREHQLRETESRSPMDMIKDSNKASQGSETSNSYMTLSNHENGSFTSDESVSQMSVAESATSSELRINKSNDSEDAGDCITIESSDGASDEEDGDEEGQDPFIVNDSYESNDAYADARSERVGSSTPRETKEKNISDSVICLSDSEPENTQADDSVEILSDNGSSAVPAEEILPPKPSNYQLMKYNNDSNEILTEKLRLAKKTLASIGSVVKDGGAKLRQQIEDLECMLSYRNVNEPQTDALNEKKTFVPTPPHAKEPQSTDQAVKKVFVPTAPQIIDTKQAKFNDDMYNKLCSNDTKRNYGGKMNEDRIVRVEHVTEVAVKVMMNAMSTIPEEHHIVETPDGLKIDLMAHQKQGLAWLAWRETQRPPCGILADDMGLGKTLSMISLVLHQKNELRKRKDEGDLEEYNKRRRAAKKNGYIPSNATLVVAPASLIYQWEQEVQRRVDKGRLKVAVFHGPKNKRESDPIRLASYDIVITTYNLVTTELTEKITTANNAEQYSSDDSGDEQDNHGAQASLAKNKKQKTKISKNSNSVLARICWARIILDEAHQIKNKGTGASKAACRLVATSRWCLTGTPIHNNLWDLYSLIRFMRVAPFDEEKHWKEYIMCSTKMATERLNLLVKSLLLRRTKSQTSILTNQPLVDLQPKVVENHDLLLEGIEAQVYDVMFRATQQKVKQMLSEADNQKHDQLYGFHRRNIDKGQQMKNPFNFGPRTIGAADKFQQMSCMLVMLLRLRQACVHMHLTKEAVDMDAFEHLGGDAVDADALLEQTMANMTLEDDEGREIPAAAAIFERDYMSCKIKKLMEIVEKVLELNDKIVIVSQWTSLLDIVEEKLRARSTKYTAITGKVLPADRQERVDSFNKEKGGAQVMLLSLTAGGVGLNLIGGNHLVMVDLHWNPALEAQACDRIYRMGQKKTVHIHRLVTTGTIEQRVVDLQKKKLELAGSVLEGAVSRKMNKISLTDLRFLFDLDKKEERAIPSQVPSSSNPPYRNPMAQGPTNGPAQNHLNSGRFNPSSSGNNPVQRNFGGYSRPA